MECASVASQNMCSHSLLVCEMGIASGIHAVKWVETGVSHREPDCFSPFQNFHSPVKHRM